MSRQLIATWKWLEKPNVKVEDHEQPFKVQAFDSRKELEEYCMIRYEDLYAMCTTTFPFNVIEIMQDNHEVTDQFNLYIERT